MASPKTFQILSELISVAYTVEVGVINSGKISIAGTGSYRKNIGKPVPHKSIAAKCLGTPESLLIKNAGESRYCRHCLQQPHCPYNAALLCPIYTGPSINGILMLLATNESQRQVMLKNIPKLRKDIVSMADLFSGYFLKGSNIEGDERFLSMITESQDDGMILVSDSYQITHLNEAARLLLSCEDHQILGKNLDDVFFQSGFTKNDLSQSCMSNRSSVSVSLEKTRGKRSLSYFAKPVKVDDKLAGYILKLEKKRPIKKYSRPLNIEQHDFFSGIIGESYEIRKVINDSRIISTTDSTVLLLGETGTGKDVLANAIHKASLRSTGPFVALNCSLMNENLLESELFGYEEGAFTGARKGGKKGKIELAHNGTLFLDEIGELPRALQAKYLRVIEDGIVEKIGCTNPLLKVNVRIIAATNNDLKQMVSNGTFRKDLYYRINTYTIKLPPLRERAEDILILTDYFISKQTEQRES